MLEKIQNRKPLLLTGSAAGTPAPAGRVSGLHACVAVENEELAEDLGRWLSQHGIQPRFELTADLNPPPALFLVGAGNSMEERAGRIRAWYPASSILAVIANREDAAALLSAFRAGVHDFLFPPYEEELARALRQRRHGSCALVRGPKEATVVGFVSAKGGCGATTIACYVAEALARLNTGRVLLADMDLWAGIVALLTQVESRYSIVDALENLHRMDASLWQALVARRGGLELLPAPKEAGDADQVDAQSICQFLPFLRGQYDFAVLDLGCGVNEFSLALAREVDQLMVVSTVERPALWAASRVCERVRQGGLAAHRVRVILNRAGTSARHIELERMLSEPVYARLPGCYRALQDCIWDKKMMAARSVLGRHCAELAARIAGVRPAAAPAGPATWLRRIIRSRRTRENELRAAV